MILFENKSYDRFFNPFSCRNKRIYYDCITVLIETSKTADLLHEMDARDALILYFRNCAYAVEEEVVSDDVEELISGKKTAEENASAVLRYFRHCGWISDRELARNGDNLATVNPYCRKLIGAVNRIFRQDNKAVLTNQIFAIYDVLYSVFVVDSGRAVRPYSNILVPTVEAVEDLKNELHSLKDSIREIMRLIIKMTEVNAMGQFLIKDEMMKTFFNDYFFIKKDGLIPGYIAEIETMLNRVKDTDVYERIIKEYQALYDVTELQARDIIERQFSMVRQFITYEYVRTMDDIDNRINDYYNLYATRILMVISNSINLQSYINNVLMMLKDFSGTERKSMLEGLGQTFDLQSYKYIGSRSIKRRRKRKPNTKTGALTRNKLSNDEIEELTKELLYEQADKYGVKAATAYFDALFTDEINLEMSGFKYCLRPNDKNVTSHHDALMMAASIIYSGSYEFPYEVTFLGGTVNTGVATISNIEITRKDERSS